jgi:hypothetical protein
LAPWGLQINTGLWLVIKVVLRTVDYLICSVVRSARLNKAKNGPLGVSHFLLISIAGDNNERKW